MKAEELPTEVLEYFLNLLKLSKIYANFVSSLGYETIEEIDLKTVQLLNCRFTCAESSNVSGIYNLWYSCNNIWINITVEERKVSRELLRRECTKPPPYNFYVLFGGLIFPEEGEVVWTIQFGLKNKVPISLRLNNLSFTLVNGISLYDGSQLTLSIWESTRGNYIDVNLLSFDKGLAKDLPRSPHPIAPNHPVIPVGTVPPSSGHQQSAPTGLGARAFTAFRSEHGLTGYPSKAGVLKPISVKIHIDYEGNIEEYEKNLRRNPENAYKLATSLLTYLYSNQIFRGNVNEATTFLRHFFSMYTAFLLY
jgi:hypothetical protein